MQPVGWPEGQAADPADLPGTRPLLHPGRGARTGRTCACWARRPPSTCSAATTPRRDGVGQPPALPGDRRAGRAGDDRPRPALPVQPQRNILYAHQHLPSTCCIKTSLRSIITAHVTDESRMDEAKAQIAAYLRERHAIETDADGQIPGRLQPDHPQRRARRPARSGAAPSRCSWRLWRLSRWSWAASAS